MGKTQKNIIVNETDKEVHLKHNIKNIIISQIIMNGQK